MHLMMSSLNANFNHFVELLENGPHFFNVVCLSLTWISNNNFQKNSPYNLPSYVSIPFETKDGQKG